MWVSERNLVGATCLPPTRESFSRIGREISIQDWIGENGVPVCKLESSHHPSSLANSGTALVIENSLRSFSPMCARAWLFVCLLVDDCAFGQQNSTYVY